MTTKDFVSNDKNTWSQKRKDFHKRNEKINPNVGKCIVCGNPTEWDEDRGKYARLCGSQECKDILHNQHKSNTKKKYGVEYRMSDISYQRELHSKQRRAKNIEKDGKKFYTLSKVEETVLKTILDSGEYGVDDIFAPAEFNITYMYKGEDKKHIPDLYIKSLNLIISSKDDINNPNKMLKDDRVKSLLEYQSILTNTNFNLIQIEGEKEAKDIMKILKQIKSVVKKGGRFILPPRVDVMMYSETYAIYGESPKRKINYILVSEDNHVRFVFDKMRSLVINGDGGIYKEEMFNDFVCEELSEYINDDSFHFESVMRSNVFFREDYDIIIEAIEDVRNEFKI